jgi:hypothetical protein
MNLIWGMLFVLIENQAKLEVNFNEIDRVQLKVVVRSEALYNLLVSDQRAFSTTEATDHH